MIAYQQSLWASVTLSVSILIGTLGIANNTYAAATLAFFPQRVILEDKSRTSVLRLTNRGDHTGNFRISMVDLIYANDGSVKQVSTLPAGFPSARPYVRFSPSQVKLNPGESQNIRVLLKRPNTIPAGERRVHISMQEIPDPSAFSDLVSDNQETIKKRYAIGEAVAIPLIIRRGNTHATATINTASRTAHGINVTLGRSGNQSLYTNIEVYSGTIEKSNLLSIIKGVAVPVPNHQRAISVHIKNPTQQPYIVVLKDHNSGDILTQKRL